MSGENKGVGTEPTLKAHQYLVIDNQASGDLAVFWKPFREGRTVYLSRAGYYTMAQLRDIRGDPNYTILQANLLSENGVFMGLPWPLADNGGGPMDDNEAIQKYNSYDSTADTLSHIHMVRMNISFMTSEMARRATRHDLSKLEEPEKSGFDKWTPALKGLTYGTPEYMDALGHLQETIDAHYAANDHHPEHHEHGVRDMNIFQLLEMMADWEAASHRHADGNFWESLVYNRKRFKIPSGLYRLMCLTAAEMWGPIPDGFYIPAPESVVEVDGPQYKITVYPPPDPDGPHFIPIYPDDK